jgi:hypothetical protein
MNNFNKIPDTVLENALIGTSDLFNRNIIEHVCFQQRMSLDICFENWNLHFKKAQQLTVSNAFPAQDFI